VDPDLTNMEWEQDEPDPRCDECNTSAFAMASDEWCGSCGCCKEHCLNYVGCGKPVCGHCDGDHASRDCAAVTRIQESEFVTPKTMQEADELLEELR
jgi:hypothetical protein